MAKKVAKRVTLEELGVGGGPIPERNLDVALGFFDVHMPGLSREDCVSYLKAMDLHAPARQGVEQVRMQPGMRLARFSYQGKGAPVFFTKAGSSPFDLGIDAAGRGFESWEVMAPCAALRSRCSGFRGQAGGGIQYIVPNASVVMRKVRAGTRTQAARGPDVKLPDWF